MNLNATIDRRNTDSLKYDFAAERGRPENLLPLWVADMDFRAPQPVIDALAARTQHGIFGYTETKRDYFDAVADWFTQHHGWTPEESWIVKTPGVVFALAMAVKAFTDPHDAVLIQPPVYYPFFEVIRDNDRRVVENELLYHNGRYTIDFADLETKLKDEHVKLMLLCSPHNPVGRVWTPAELQKIASLCVKHGVILVSDEIHCDFARPGHGFTSAMHLSEVLKERLVLCTAPSKTFNLAGLQVSNIFIPNETLRKKFKHQIDAAGYSQLNTMGLLACKTAYREGAPWLSNVKQYVEENLLFLRDYLEKHIPEIKLVEPDGTYLAWLDCGGLGLSGKALDDFITKEAGLWLDGGSMFGGRSKRSERFQRLNFACSRETLTAALQKLESAVNARKKSNL